MSRVLVVLNDPRTVPYSECCWWRHKLMKRPEDGTLVTQSIDLPKDVDWPSGYEVWSGFFEYYDGRDDWSFPYLARTTNGEPHRMWGSGIMPNRIMYLDILALTPPGCDEGSKWYPISAGSPAHPSDKIQWPPVVPAMPRW